MEEARKEARGTFSRTKKVKTQTNRRRSRMIGNTSRMRLVELIEKHGRVSVRALIALQRQVPDQGK